MSDFKSRVASMYERLNRRDAGAIAEIMHDDLLDHSSHAEIKGRAAHEAHTVASFEAFPDLRFDVDDLIDGGDSVVARGRLSGTHRGAFMGAPATGKAFSIGWISIYRFRGDKIAERWLQGDDFGMMVQLGFVQPPQRPA